MMIATFKAPPFLQIVVSAPACTIAGAINRIFIVSETDAQRPLCVENKTSFTEPAPASVHPDGQGQGVGRDNRQSNGEGKMTIDTLGYSALLAAVFWVSGKKIDLASIGIFLWYAAVAVTLSAGAYYTMANLHHHTHHRSHE